MKGFGGGPGGANIQGLMKQAQKMQEQLAKAQAESENVKCEFQSGGGVVKATSNGKGELIELFIDSSVIDPNDKEVLEKMILSTVNGAITAAKDKVKAELEKITGGMSIPGLF